MSEDGFVVGEIMPIPIMTLMVSWLGIEGMTDGIYYHTDRIYTHVEVMHRYFNRQIQLASETPAEIIWFCDNVTGTIISPTLFERYEAPEFKWVMPMMRSVRTPPALITMVRTAHWLNGWRIPACRL